MARSLCPILVCLILLLALYAPCEAQYLPGPAPEWSLLPGQGIGTWYDLSGDEWEMSGGFVRSMTGWNSALSEFRAVVSPGTWLIFEPVSFLDYDLDPQTGYLQPYPVYAPEWFSLDVSGAEGLNLRVRPTPDDPRPYASISSWRAPFQSGRYSLDLTWPADEYCEPPYYPESVNARGEVVVTPEPASIALLSSGFLCLPWFLQRRRRPRRHRVESEIA